MRDEKDENNNEPEPEKKMPLALVPDLGAGRVGTETREQLVADVLLDRHRPRVYLEDVRPTLQVRQVELPLPIHPT